MKLPLTLKYPFAEIDVMARPEGLQSFKAIPDFAFVFADKHTGKRHTAFFKVTKGEEPMTAYDILVTAPHLMHDISTAVEEYFSISISRALPTPAWPYERKQVRPMRPGMTAVEQPEEVPEDEAERYNRHTGEALYGTIFGVLHGNHPEVGGGEAMVCRNRPMSYRLYIAPNLSLRVVEVSPQVVITPDNIQPQPYPGAQIQPYFQAAIYATEWDEANKKYCMPPYTRKIVVGLQEFYAAIIPRYDSNNPVTGKDITAMFQPQTLDDLFKYVIIDFQRDLGVCEK